MSQKLFFAVTVVSLSFVMFFAGCGPESKEPAKIEVELVEVAPVEVPSAQIALKFEAGDVSTYKSGYETKQFVELDMAVKTPVKDKKNSKNVDVVFTQKILSIADDSSALAKITIKKISVLMKDTEGVSFDFDSSKAADAKRSLNALIGKNYTINISSDGKVTPADVKDIRRVKIIGGEKKVADNLLSDAEIIKRHAIHLPAKDASTVEEGKGWGKVVWSHPKIMAVKSFEKTYVLKEVSDDVANVTMTAYETDKTADGSAPQAGGFGFMAGMFDSKEKYSGEMLIDLKSGKVIKWNEKCVATYVVTDPTSKNDKEEPASLTMGLTHSTSLQKID